VSVDVEPDLETDPEPEPEPEGGDDVRSPRPGPSLWQAIALVLAVAFASSALTAWWVSRDPQPNDADIGFYDDMSTHHLQGVDIASIYQRNGEDPVLLMIASKIAFSQTGDIRQMRVALADWGAEVTPGVAMEWMGMPVPQDAQPGMATPEEIDALEAARGSELDDMFTRMMIDHHDGGIHMAQNAEALASIDSVKALATSMVKNQQDDISDMNLRRTQLGLPVYEP
jgi:uncharacterized protein (DUF305 family)